MNIMIAILIWSQTHHTWCVWIYTLPIYTACSIELRLAKLGIYLQLNDTITFTYTFHNISLKNCKATHKANFSTWVFGAQCGRKMLLHLQDIYGTRLFFEISLLDDLSIQTKSQESSNFQPK